MSIDPTGKIEFTNLDLYSKEGWQTFLNQRKERAVKLSRKKNPGFVDAILAFTRHPETGEPRPAGQYMLAYYVTFFNSPTNNDDEVNQQKDGFALTMNSAAIAGAAIASVFRSESWVSVQSMPTEGEAPEPRVQPRKNPKRKEIISIMTDHREFGMASFSAIITPHKSKPWKRVIGPWLDAGMRVSGRFSSFLPRPELVDDPTTLWAAREYLKRHRGLEKVYENTHASGPYQ